MVKGRWERDMASKADKQQGRFTQEGWLMKPAPEPKIEFTTINAEQLVMCPFCLHQAKLKAFFVSTKKGISQGKAQCPECKNGMLMKSLWQDMTPEQYAEWVYNYSRSGFWKKCPFDIWKVRLKNIGWAGQFWTRYKELKGDDDTQTVFSDADRMARDYGIDIHDR